LSGYYVIGYDISDPRRLQKVHREMLRHAAPLEYSIFLLEGNGDDAKRCMDSVLKLIHAGQDDVRCYPLPAHGLQLRLGKMVLPEGILWTGLPVRAN